MTDPTPTDPARRAAEELARDFHETYERLAPSFGYKTRKRSAVPWEEVPNDNRELMVAVAREIRARHFAELEQLRDERDVYKEANESARVCQNHVDEFIGRDCLVCNVVLAQRQRDAALEVVRAFTGPAEQRSHCVMMGRERCKFCWGCQLHDALRRAQALLDEQQENND